MNALELQKLGHALDAGWLMALWLAIHGGDPPPQNQVIAENESLDFAALALVTRLAELYPGAAKNTVGALINLKKLGISVTASFDNERVFPLDSAEAHKNFMATLSEQNEWDGLYFKVCSHATPLSGQTCTIMHKVAW
jgi:hypothetical protein